MLEADPLESLEIGVKAQTVVGALIDKLCAFSKIYPGGGRSSRWRDLPDMLHLKELAGDRAAQEVAGTLARLELALPSEFPPMPGDWPSALVDRTGKKLETEKVHKELEAFWAPLLAPRTDTGGIVADGDLGVGPV